MLKRIKYLKYCWGVGGLLMLFYFTHSWGFVPNVPNPAIWAMLAYIIARSVGGGKPLTLSLFFLLMCPLGIIFSNPDPCFKSWLRYGNFVLLFLAIGPVFFSSFANKVRLQALSTLLLLSIFTGVVSFFGFFLGINYMTMGGAQKIFRESAGSFGGLCVHSMTLGPIAALGCVALFYGYMRHQKKIYLYLLICSLGAVFFAASRSAFLAALAGIAGVTYYISEQRTKMVRRIMGLCVLAAVTFPIWNQATYLLRSKQENNIASGSLTSSRDAKFEARIYEFKESPLFGVGFCAIDPATGDEFSYSTGQIEPGTAWLQVPSMTGLAGTIPFIMLLLFALNNSKRQKAFAQRGLMIGLLFTFFLHFFAEGYLFSAGGELCMYAWLVIASCCMPWYDYVDNEGHMVSVDEI